MRPRRLPLLLAISLLSGSLAACSAGSSQAGGESDSKPKYEETKSMVLDILHSKEGRDTLTDVIKEPSVKRSMFINEADISTALIKTFNDEKNQKHFLEAQMKDPKFAAAIVTASKKEHEQILKQLLKDPDYQQSMLTIMKSPEYQTMTIALMQSPEYRQYIMKVLAESLQNPEFKLVFMDIVKEAIRSGSGVSKTGQEGQGQKAKTQGTQPGGDQQKNKKEET